MTRLIFLWLCLSLGGADAEQAQGGSTPKPAAKAADYGPAFARLVKLGLPDAKEASYVKLTLQAGKGAGERDYYGGYGSGRGPGRDGNAWLLPGAKDGAATLIHKRFGRVSVVRMKKRGGLMRALIGKRKAPKGEGAVGDWEPVVVSKDTDKMIKELDGMAKQGRVFDGDRWEYDTSAAQMAAKVLVTACHMYRSGHKAEGNRLAQKILSLSPQPELVIDAVVNELAEQQYRVLVSAFLKDKDWKTYHAGLQALVERFPRGWKGRLGALILLPKLEQKLKGEKAKLADFKGITLKPEAVELLDGLLTRTDPVVVRPTPLWLLVKPVRKPQDPDSGYVDESEPPAEPWMMKLCAMGMDGFVALAAAAADETLLATTIRSGTVDAYSRSYVLRSMTGSQDSLDEQALTAYASMERPCTRGEIARKILISTMPDADNELDAKSPEELRDIAYQWWLAHRADSKSALARHIMQAGESDQRMLAVKSLISSGNERDAKLVEDYIMNAESLSASVAILEPYLKSRRGKAREFFNNYSKMLTDLAASGDSDSLPWNLRREGALPKFLKRLSVYVDDITPEKILADMKSGKTTVKEGLTMLAAASGADAAASHLPAVVAAAVARKKPTERAAALQELVGQIYRNYRQAGGDGREAYEKKLAAALPGAQQDWAKLLERTEPPADEEEKKALNSLPSLAVYSAWALEMVHFPQHSETLQRINGILGREEMNRFILRRARQVLADPAAAFPDPGKVAPERGAAIRADIAKLDPAAIMAYYAKLPLVEKLAWARILGGYEGNPPAGVVGLGKMIVKTDWSYAPDGDAASREQIDALVLNKKLDRELVLRVLAELAKNPERHAPRLLLFQGVAEGGTGLTLHVWSGSQARSLKKNVLTEEAVKRLSEGKAASLVGLSTYADSEWLAGVKYQPAHAGQEADKTIGEIIRKTETALSDGSRFNLVIFAETAGHLKKQPSEEEEE